MGGAAKWYEWICGVGGHGKTVRLRSLYRAARGAGHCGVFVDPNGKNGDLGRVVQRVRDLPAELKRGRPFSIIYQPEFGDDTSALWPMCNAIGRLFLGVDEAGQWGDAASFDRKFLELVRVGRNQHVNIAATFQAPSDMHPKLRQQADAWVSFRQVEPLYARTMEAKFLRRPGAADVLLQLPRLHYLRATLPGGFMDVTHGVVKIPG